jgi:DNA polymerase I
MLVFDIETDGLQEDVTVVRCINIIDRTTGKRLSYNGGVYASGGPAPRDGTIEDGIALLATADCLVGHNILRYDLPVLQLLHGFTYTGRVLDTQVCCQVIWTNLTDMDFAAIARGKLSHDFQKDGLIGKQSLEAWGRRLGVCKGDFKPGNYPNPEADEPGAVHTWKTIGFTEDMDTYGRQDVEVTLALVEKIESKNYSPECLALEHAVAQIVWRQTARGFAFDTKAALALAAKLQVRHAEIASELTTVFQPWYAPDVHKGTALFVPKSDNKKHGYVAGAAMSKVKCVVFNAGSRDHIADRLQKLRGWHPTQFTDGGKPQVDESTLGPLPWPEAKLLTESLLIEKRLGQIADGKEAWLKHARLEDDGVYRIHGSVSTNGAVTGRMTHSYPNVAQTPRVGSPYGEECRACWIVTPGLALVGCDADGLELRMLAHFMAKWDGGAYCETVVNGRKEDKTDVHSVNQAGAGLNSRDSAKTFIYAMLYGAGDFKLGTTVYDDFTEEQRARFNERFAKKKERAAALKRLGSQRRAKLIDKLPAFGQLVEAVKGAAQRGYLKGLDGRLLHVRSPHAALNTLLQSAGAIVMKKALVILDHELDTLRSAGRVAACVGNVHDEFIIESTKEIANEVGAIAAESIRLAGDALGLRVPLKGNFAVGDKWSDVH